MELSILTFQNENHRFVIGKFLKQAWNYSIHHKVWNFLFGSLGGIVAIYKSGPKLFDNEFINGILTIACFTTCAFIIVFFISLIHQFWRHLKHIWIQSKINAELDQVRKICRHIESLRGITDHKIIYSNLVKLCDFLRLIFNNRSKSECSVSIKIPLNPGNKSTTWLIHNYCRDQTHQDSRDTEKYINAEHTILNNTPYHEIVYQILSLKKVSGYYNPDIANSQGYKNSSIVRDCEKGFPYNSELVYPILDEPKIEDLAGFLCVDCVKSYAFEDGDISMNLLKSVSQQIYYLISDLRDRNIRLRNEKYGCD